VQYHVLYFADYNVAAYVHVGGSHRVPEFAVYEHFPVREERRPGNADFSNQPLLSC
jgi:hypothetical protein